MANDNSGIVLDPSDLSEATLSPQIEPTAPRELPKPLADFKRYADSKFCYYSKPVENAEIIAVQQKAAFRCQMTIFMEAREVRMEVTPHRWTTDKVLGSRSLGK